MGKFDLHLRSNLIIFKSRQQINVTAHQDRIATKAGFGKAIAIWIGFQQYYRPFPLINVEAEHLINFSYIRIKLARFEFVF